MFFINIFFCDSNVIHYFVPPVIPFVYKPAFNTKSKNASAVAYVSAAKARNSTTTILNTMENINIILFTFSIFNFEVITSVTPLAINKKNNPQ